MVRGTDDWLDDHAGDGGIAAEPIDHPEHDWVRLLCVCGGTHLTERDTAIQELGLVNAPGANHRALATLADWLRTTRRPRE